MRSHGRKWPGDSRSGRAGQLHPAGAAGREARGRVGHALVKMDYYEPKDTAILSAHRITPQKAVDPEEVGVAGMVRVGMVIAVYRVPSPP